MSFANERWRLVIKYPGIMWPLFIIEDLHSVACGKANTCSKNIYLKKKTLVRRRVDNVHKIVLIRNDFHDKHKKFF